jgi:hypothetical protein
MENIHALEPNVHMYTTPILIERECRGNTSRNRNLLRPGKRAGCLVGTILLALLERLKLLSTPRIISAECLSTGFEALHDMERQGTIP